MRRAALVTAAALAVAAPLSAQQQERVHVVRPGETLWDLARTYLSDPFLWPEIFRLNTDVVEDPARIYPNERLVLPAGVAARQEGGVEPGRTVFYRGERDGGDRDRLTILPAGTGNFPVVRQGDFYRASFVAPDAEVRPMGRLAEIVSPTVVPLQDPPSIQLFDRVYVTLDGGAARIGDRIHFVKPGRLLPSHGRVWESRGIGTVAAVEENVATVVIVRMYDQVQPGDLALPAAAFPVRAGVRPAPARGESLQASILAFEEPHPLQAIEEIAFLTVGRREGVREGDEFEVYLPREGRTWGTRPEISVGRLQVVRVTDGAASVRITNLVQPAIAVGLPVRRVASMPASGGGASGR
ncbi:MAG TPA: LysM domain-containing protein [Longimicrobium sp.]|nr:LysM domain-containing protein [Longimicrobium sp.]